MGKIKDYVAIIKVKTRERLNPYFAGFRRKQLKNNCWGGTFIDFSLCHTTPQQ